MTDGMSEDAFLALMLAVCCFEVAVAILGMVYFEYKTRKSLQQIEGVSAAVFLEVRKVLSQSR